MLAYTIWTLCFSPAGRPHIPGQCYCGDFKYKKTIWIRYLVKVHDSFATSNKYIYLQIFYPHSEMYSDKHLRVQFSVIILCLFHILQRSWLQFQCTLWRLTWGYDLGSQNQDPPRAEYLTQIGKVHCLIMEKIGQMTHFSRTNYLYFYLLALLPTEKKILKRKKERERETKRKGNVYPRSTKLSFFKNLYFEMKMQFSGGNIFF